MKLLITGFDPFGGGKINPAWEAVSRLPEIIDEVDIVKLQIPTVFKKSAQKLFQAIEEEKPDAVICVGQAGGRYDISIERVAINIDDARIEDNEGNKPLDVRVFEDGENAYFSNLPIKAMVEEIKKEGIPASISNTAGTYVCNHIMYSLLYYINKKGLKNIRGGFIHVPLSPKQAIDMKNTPFMDIDLVVKALEAAIRAVSLYEEDKLISGGTEI